MKPLDLPLTPVDFDLLVITPAFAYLPMRMDSIEARCMLIAICLQESRLASRWQIVNGGGKGPARGLAQFEKGTPQSRGGVCGVMLHSKSSGILLDVCKDMGIPFDAQSIYEAVETNDELSAILARLLLYTDPRPLPKLNDEDGAWEVYQRNWRPGKPRPEKWTINHRKAVAALDRRDVDRKA